MSPLVPHAVLDEIRLANDIVNVIGAYFQLQRSGSGYKALCPFHKEKTPSFMVNPQRQIFHCFGCDIGGDVFRFVMNYEKVDFMTAVKMLAGKANIRLTFEALTEDEKIAKDVLYEIMALASRLYQKILLHSPEAEKARNYLATRALDRKAVEEFLIGYAPDQPDTVMQWAGKKYQRKQLEASGLLATSTSASATQWYERFRNRLMFPVRDEQGRVVGFSGRILKDEAQTAKYINTPETPLFHKGRLLYALDRARRAILEQHEAIVCEGQIDVIRCHLAGFNAAVAAQGTAFTDDHARILKRYADGVILAFDPDSAGQKAAMRAAETFLRSDLAVRVAVLPKGTDPDTLLRQTEGPSRFRAILEGAKSVVDFQIDVLSAEAKPDTEAALMRISATLINTILQTPNAILRSAMLKNAAERLGIPANTLSTELKIAEKRRRTFTVQEAAQREDKLPPREEMALVEHLLYEQKLSALVKKYLPLNLITNDSCRQIITICLEAEEGLQNVLRLIAERDDEERSLSALVARASGAPQKIKSDFATHEESVKSLILALRREALQKQRREIEIKLQAARLASAGMPARERKQLEIEHIQLGYDLVKLKQWEAALPIMEL